MPEASNEQSEVTTEGGQTIAALCGTLTVFLATQPLRAELMLQTLLKRGQFAGLTADSLPSGYVDAERHIMGYCSDVARYLARGLGVTLQFVQVNASSRVPSLQTSRIDAEVAVTIPGMLYPLGSWISYSPPSPTNSMSESVIT